MAEPFVCPADCDEEGALHLDMPRKQYQAITKARFAGKRVDIEVRDRKSKRSDRQNALFWRLLTPWARELGYGSEELKDELLGLLWGWDEAASPLTGEPRRVPKKPRSSRLSTSDFADLIDFMVMKAAETGYVMDLPDDLRQSKSRRGTA